jgi:pyruvate formate lyase activating enzyme
VQPANYAQITSIALDPIEKKPLARFNPGSKVLSVGSYGCNMRCPFCQNSNISTMDYDYAVRNASVRTIEPAQIVELAGDAKDNGNIGIAYTYNEPLVGYEYVYDCAVAAHETGLVNVLVSNGYINDKPWRRLLPLIDAANIDLKGFTQEFYDYVSAPFGLDVVKHNIMLAAAIPTLHLEVTTLIIPGRNDSESEIAGLSAWLASLDEDITLHLTRFFPRYELLDTPPTPKKTLYTLAKVAERNLEHVYIGNV